MKANKGSSGIDGETLEVFEKNLKNNLYKLWNRMSSGSYLPPPVKLVEINKKAGGTRSLGIPTVTDRIAQMVVKMTLEPELEPFFHSDSYGYRPGKSAIEAVGRARERCWRYDWVIDLDIKGFFDNLRHDLLLKALQKHTKNRWVLLYIQRWLIAPLQQKDGTLISRDKGTPQGSVISPLLANLYLHYAMDEWLRIHYPKTPFERYADDVVVHCKTEKGANDVLSSLKNRMAECGLELHPEKTKIVYCKDDDRRGNYPITKFDFLGFTFRRRRSKNRWGKYFVNFSPAVSDSAKKSMRKVMRSWKVHLRSDKSLDDISHMFNPILRGWFIYYGKYYKSELYCVFDHFNRTLSRWAMRKYKRLRGHNRRAIYRIGLIANEHPNLFYHWQIGLKPSTGQ
ncbi:MAG: group II intron reverse transcriptase/maturase [candidate division Zixibacteria bacterium]|nr:group II intron reverse transcriptase/maturase [candidate division Zixibacteria bacterium]